LVFLNHRQKWLRTEDYQSEVAASRRVELRSKLAIGMRASANGKTTAT
jgi:hypothetical protein